MTVTAAETSRLLTLKLPHNDARAPDVRAYLLRLLTDLWREEDGFSGKRPFGHSGWKYEIYAPMIAAGIITGTLDEDGSVTRADTRRGEELVLAAIASLVPGS